MGMMKRFAEDVSAQMGLGGEITPAVLDVAQAKLNAIAVVDRVRRGIEDKLADAGRQRDTWCERLAAKGEKPGHNANVAYWGGKMNGLEEILQELEFIEDEMDIFGSVQSA